MHLSDYSLSQLSEFRICSRDSRRVDPSSTGLEQMKPTSSPWKGGRLRCLRLRALEDLKEARERLRQAPTNSSRPPCSRAAWERAAADHEDKSPDAEAMARDPADEASAPTEDPSDPPQTEATKPDASKPEKPKGKPGEQPDAPGFGRTQVFKAHETLIHRPDTGAACALALPAEAPSV